MGLDIAFLRGYGAVLTFDKIYRYYKIVFIDSFYCFYDYYTFLNWNWISLS